MPSPRQDNHKPYLHLFGLGACLVILLGLNMHYIWGTDGFDWPKLGSRADLFSGFVSPFLNLLAFGGVLYTINL